VVGLLEEGAGGLGGGPNNNLEGYFRRYYCNTLIFRVKFFSRSSKYYYRENAVYNIMRKGFLT
jgi:hypothetical protein